MAAKSKKPTLTLAAPPAANPAPEAVAAPAEAYYRNLETLSREGLDAVLKANTALVEGLEAIAKEAAAHLCDTVTAAGQATKDALGARTLDQLVGIQAGLAKSSWGALLRRSTQLSELGLAVAKGVWTPLAGHAQAALAKAKHAAG